MRVRVDMYMNTEASGAEIRPRVGNPVLGKFWSMKMVSGCFR